MALGILSAIPGIGAIVKEAGNLIKSYWPPDMSEIQKAEQTMKLREFEQNFSESLIKAQMQMETELSIRQKTDMTSDSWLSKNIRPMVLIYLLIMFTAMCITSITLDLKPEYVKMLQEMLTFAFGFYFGGRTFEKIVKLTKGGS